MSGLLTVIVPVYNTERFLPRCLDSIAGQTYGNLEIILVDDGSTDDSGRICDEYAVRDRRIRVIHKGNGGASSARNEGLAVASGEFVAFVDSDDFLDLDAYRLVMDVRSDTDPDVACFGMSFLHGKKEMRVPFSAADDLFTKFRKYRTYMHSPCNKIIRRKSLGGRTFQAGIQVQEDLLLMFDLMTDGCSVMYLGDVLYHYRRDNPESVTRQFRKNMAAIVRDQEEVYHAVLEICSMRGLTGSRTLRRYMRFLNAWMALPYINSPSLFSPDTFREKCIPWNFYSLRPDIFMEELFAFLGMGSVSGRIVALKTKLRLN